MKSSRSDRSFVGSVHTNGNIGTEFTRVERDSLGEVEVPAEAYWGVNTARALANFAISGRPIAECPDLIVSYAQVKQAAARANAEIGVMASETADLIDEACAEIVAGDLLDQFVVDVLQGGAGTSTNMNVNEVIANRALELGGYPKGDYERISPNDHVNMAQSTNDTYPTAFRLALHRSLERLMGEMKLIEKAFAAKGEEFAHIIKVGRTQLQDAVPMTLGQEFAGFAKSIRGCRSALERVLPELRTISLGATAIGTGITADSRYAEAARRHLGEITGLELTTAEDLVAATSDMGVFIELSGGLKRFAMVLSKVCNDLRLLSSGPQVGFGDIKLPPRQAGSSLMPGKVNPVICEAVNQVAFMVLGSDVVVSMASEAGQLQLNAFGPVMALSLLTSEKWLTGGLMTLRENCVDGIVADEACLAANSSSFAGIVTAFVPYIGYEAAGEVVEQALASGRSVAELVVDAGLMLREDVETLLRPGRLAGADTTEPVLAGDYARTRLRT